MQDFTAYGPSHWIVLLIFGIGAVALVAVGRGETGMLFSRMLAVVVIALQVAIQVYSLAPSRFDINYSLPLHLSDLAGYVAAYALWSHGRRAFALTYYWCLTLSVQALITPALRGPDFPHVGFIAFWGIHVLVVWAACYLTWGRRLRPDWRSYRFAVAVTATWAAFAFVFNSIADTNYGFLNAKPGPGSVLDLLGPWPWYLVPEFALVLGVWALMTLPWVRRNATALSTRS